MYGKLSKVSFKHFNATKNMIQFYTHFLNILSYCHGNALAAMIFQTGRQLFQVPSARIRIFLKTHLFYPYKKDPRPHEDRFQKHSPPHENTVTYKFTIRKWNSIFDNDIGHSNFDERKQTNIMFSLAWSPKNRAHFLICSKSTRSRQRFRKALCFHPSTRQHEKGVFKNIHSGERFRKLRFQWLKMPSPCGREPKTDKKRYVFKQIRIRVDRASVTR